MNLDHSRYAEWDAAYVIGALSASDRREYESHLDECADCRRAVAELGPTVGLLSRLSAEEAMRVDEALAGEAPVAGPGAQTRAGLVSLARERARRRRRVLWYSLAAAVVLVVAAVAIPVTIAANSGPTVAFALEDVADVPLTASVRLTDVGWGTRIELDCRYPSGYAGAVPEGGWTYGLTVVAEDGTASTVSTWRASPGTTARLSAGTALEVSGIRAVEIRSESGTVLMRYELGG